MFLSDSLKRGEWPLWNRFIGNGFPALAEGQTGVFNISNIFLFKFLPFFIAWNSSYVLIFLTTMLGTYVYARSIGLKKGSSFFSSFLFTFSGIFITHISHFNLIQTASFIPWVFWSLQKLMQKSSLRWVIVSVFFLAQQFFSGFPQIIFITGIAFGIILLGQFLQKKSGYVGKKPLVAICLAFLFVIGVCAIQWMPQIEFLGLSNRQNMLLVESTQYSFPPKHFLSFLSPYMFGDPRRGTYPDFITADGSIFWEVTGYIGIIPLLFIGAALFLIKKSSAVQRCLLLLGISALLMLGKYSPFYFIFGLPLFNLFRAPARFIFPFVWSLCILSGVGLDLFSSWLRKRVNRIIYACITSVLISLALVDLFHFGLTYNALMPMATLDKVPQTATYIKGAGNGKFYSTGFAISWNEVFLHTGWQDMKPFLFFRNDLNPNSNTVYEIPSFGVYPILETRRYQFIRSLIDTGIVSDSQKKEFSVSSPSARLLQAFGIDYLISPLNLIGSDGSLEEVYQTASIYSDYRYRVYQVNDTAGYAYFSTSATPSATLEDVHEVLTSNTFIPMSTVIIESSDPKSYPKKVQADARIEKIDEQNSSMRFQVTNSFPGYFVVNNTYFPGWKALVDWKETRIYPANITSQAVFIDSGTHDIQFIYSPSSFSGGGKITLGTIGLMIFIAMFKIYKDFRGVSR